MTTKDIEAAAEDWAKQTVGENYMDECSWQDAAFRNMFHFKAGARWAIEFLRNESNHSTTQDQ